MNAPQINVTPLIDVLLVLLIVFMVVAPLKPSAFKARIPEDSKTEGDPNPQTLGVNINSDLSIDLNREIGLASVDDPSNLIDRLKDVFGYRSRNRDVSLSFADAPDRPTQDRIERTIFIKAPRSIDYGSVARVVDAAKRSGAFPISLQIDGLN